MKMEIRNSFEWAYPDDSITSVTNTVSLSTIKGSRVSFCALCEGKELNRIGFRFIDLPDGVTVNIFQALAVKVAENTGVFGFTLRGDEEDSQIYDADGKPYYTRKAPFYVYDALSPLSGGENLTDKEYIFFEICTSDNTIAGEYRFGIEFCGEKITVNLKLYNVPAPKETLFLTNWHSNKFIADRYNLKLWSDEHFEMIEEYVRLMRLGRQNVAWVTFDCISSSVVDGKRVFDFSLAKRLIEIYLRNGISVIEGTPFFGRDTWASTEFKINTPDGTFGAFSDEGYTYACELIPAWMKFIDENGWKPLLIQHVGDEPHNECCDEYVSLCSLVRKFMPEVPLIDAVETHKLRGGPDIWVPKNDYYERNLAELEFLRQRGDRLWFYTCCIPGGFYMNRLLDMPLLKTRFLHWCNYKYNLEGYLHWGFNHLSPDQNTLEYSEIEFNYENPNRLPSGDTHIVYSDGRKPLRSLRLEQMRAGAEEYELLRIVAEYDKDKADAILAECVESFCKCNLDADNFISVREQLLAAVSEKSV